LVLGEHLMIIKKISTILMIFKSAGLLAVMHTLVKKIFPSGNYFLSWDRRILLELAPVDTKYNAHPQACMLASSKASILIDINGQSLKSIESAIKRNETCWVIMDEDVIAAYVWISNNRIQAYSDTAYIFPVNTLNYWWRDVYVNTEYRGQGKLAELLSAWASSLNFNHDANMYCEISPDNKASIKSHKKNGFNELGLLSMVCILGFRVYYFSGSIYPKLSYRFYPKNIYYSL